MVLYDWVETLLLATLLSSSCASPQTGIVSVAPALEAPARNVRLGQRVRLELVDCSTCSALVFEETLPDGSVTLSPSGRGQDSLRLHLVLRNLSDDELIVETLVGVPQVNVQAFATIPTVTGLVQPQSIRVLPGSVIRFYPAFHLPAQTRSAVFVEHLSLRMGRTQPLVTWTELADVLSFELTTDGCRPIMADSDDQSRHATQPAP